MKRIVKKIARTWGLEILKSETWQDFKRQREEIYLAFLQNSSGVLHVGAHQVQERFLYEKYDLNVIWIEGDSQHIELSRLLLEPFPKQTLNQIMLSDEATIDTHFYVANNDGASSSLLDLVADHGFQNLSMKGTKIVDTQRADYFFSKEDICAHNHLVLDVQGAELKVLKGFGSLLGEFQSLYVEVSTYPIYKNGATFYEVSRYLETFGIYPLWQPKERSHENVLFLKFNL